MKSIFQINKILVYLILVMIMPGVFGFDIYVPDYAATIQKAIDLANDGDEVIIRNGVYTGPGNMNLDIHDKRITVRSENGPAFCLIDCQQIGRAFYIHGSGSDYAVIEGFEIRNGLYPVPNPQASPTIYSYGCGIFCEDASPIIRNCKITNCGTSGYDDYIYQGGGIGLINSDAQIRDCTLSDNIAGLGGGLYSWGSSFSVTNCTFIKNRAIKGLSGEGGAVLCGGGIDPTVVNSIFLNNEAIGVDEGGHYRAEGSGIHSYGPLMVTNCTFYTDIVISSIISAYDTLAVYTNCIIWGPSGFCADMVPIIQYSNINQTGYAGIDGNISIDPQFIDISDIDPDNWDLHLDPSSPCIEAGTNSVIGIQVDKDRNLRIIDGDLDGSGVADMGAYEYNPGPDLDNDGIYNRIDTEPKTPSNNFDDRISSGRIVSHGDQNLTIFNPNDPYGIAVYSDTSGGTVPAIIESCGLNIEMITADDYFLIDCRGSITVKVYNGEVVLNVEDISGISASAVLSTGNELCFNPGTSTFVAARDNISPIEIDVEGVVFSVAPGADLVIDTPKKGDFNGDGTIDIRDALMTAQCYVGLIDCPDLETADTNCDGSVDIVDALIVAQYYVGLITEFC